MNAVDPRRPNRPMPQEQVERIDDRIQSRFNSDRIDFYNTDRAYSLHALQKGAQATAAVLSPILLAEGGEAAFTLLDDTQLGQAAANTLRFAPRALSEYGARVLEAARTGNGCISSAVSRLAGATEEDAAAFGRAAAQKSAEIGKDVVRSQAVDWIRHGVGVLASAAAGYAAAHRKADGK